MSLGNKALNATVGRGRKMPKSTGGARAVFGWAVIGLGTFYFVGSVQEWWLLAVRRDPSRARLYPFGTEQGWAYSNPTVYAWSALWTGALALLIAVFVRYALVRHSWRWLVGVGLAYAAGVVVDLICGAMHWPARPW